MFIRRTQTRSRTDGEPYATYRLVEATRVGGQVKQMTLLNLGSQFDFPQTEWPTLAARIDELVSGQASWALSPLSEDGEVLAQRYSAQILARRPNQAEPTGMARTRPRTPAVDHAPSMDTGNAVAPPPVPSTVQLGPIATAPAVEMRAGPAASRIDNEATVQAPVVDRYQSVDLDTLDMVRPRTVGVEQAALSAMRQCGFEDKLAALGFNRPQMAAAVGNIIGRMAKPGSELATHGWLQQESGLGELLGYDFEGMDLNRLYRSSDALYRHRDALQDHLFAQAKSLFGFSETVTLYDLTNTYFEGLAQGIGKAAHGRSKEKRSDCPLVTLAMVLDGSGLPRRSQVFAGNVSEPSTLDAMLTGLGAQSGATVVMDAGIATEANLVWLREHGYHYLVVSRERARQFHAEGATQVKTANEIAIQIERVERVLPLPKAKADAEPTDAASAMFAPTPDDSSAPAVPAAGDPVKEALLYCHSPAREQKDRAIDDSMSQRFEAALQKLIDSLAKPRTDRTVEAIAIKLGRAKQSYARAAQHYQVTIHKDEAGKLVTRITWEKKPKSASAVTHPGVYCIRTTLVEQDDASLWRTYTMLTQLESVFRSLKTDLGLRPVYHQIERRVEGHLFISVLAYHFVHTLREQLKAKGVHDSWETLRTTLSRQQRITVTVQRQDGRTVHTRKATRPDPRHQTLCDHLGLPFNPGGSHRTLV